MHLIVASSFYQIDYHIQDQHMVYILPTTLYKQGTLGLHNLVIR